MLRSFVPTAQKLAHTTLLKPLDGSCTGDPQRTGIAALVPASMPTRSPARGYATRVPWRGRGAAIWRWPSNTRTLVARSSTLTRRPINAAGTECWHCRMVIPACQSTRGESVRPVSHPSPGSERSSGASPGPVEAPAAAASVPVAPRWPTPAPTRPTACRGGSPRTVPPSTSPSRPTSTHSTTPSSQPCKWDQIRPSYQARRVARWGQIKPSHHAHTNSRWSQNRPPRWGPNQPDRLMRGTLSNKCFIIVGACVNVRSRVTCIGR